MRYNDKELIKLSENKGDIEGILHHMKPQGNDWSDWYQPSSFKERYFKLISNLLFYYRINDQEPLGVLVLENVQVAYERPHKGIPFAFSLTFKVNDRYRDNESKHIFSCRCDNDVNKWVSTLKEHSYEYWRSQYIILKTKISMRTGQDPILDYMKNKNSCLTTNNNTNSEKNDKMKKINKKPNGSFFSHVGSSFYDNCFTETKINSTNPPVDNLIDL